MGPTLREEDIRDSRFITGAGEETALREEDLLLLRVRSDDLPSTLDSLSSSAWLPASPLGFAAAGNASWLLSFELLDWPSE